MSKKDNFNQAMFEMFGVGKDPGAAGAPPAAGVPPADAAATAEVLDSEVREENVLPFPPSDGPDLKVVNRPPTYLAPGTRVEGTLRAEGSVEIDGEFKGDIMAEGSVTVRTDVTGNITAKSLNVLGCCLTGDAHVSEQVQLDESSSINGNVSAGSLASSGTIIGDLTIQHNMALDHMAKVVGNVTTGTMTIARGAIIRGNVETRGDNGE